VLVEPSGAPRPSRRPSLTLNRGRLERFTPADAALLAAAVLVATGRGDLWVVAALLGLAAASAVPALITAAAGAVTLDRFGSAALADIAGAQAVVGSAAWHGASAEIAAMWLVAAALVLAARRPAVAAVAGALAGSLLAGPSIVAGFGDAALHIAAAAGGAFIGWTAAVLRPARLRPALEIGLATLSVLLTLFAIA